MNMDSVESADGQLGAVLSAPRGGMAALAPGGPWLATTPALVRAVLTDSDRFDFPSTVSRSDDLSGSRAQTRSGHATYTLVDSVAVARGLEVFEAEWLDAIAEHDRHRTGEPYDAMLLLREPVARCTTAAVLPDLDVGIRNAIGDLVLDWIDALAPIIAARRPPARWRRTRRVERASRLALEDRLAGLTDLGMTPQQVATMLAAGVQVPIAAGAFLLAWLGDQRPTSPPDPVHVVWETLRLTPPSWITARVTTRRVVIGGATIPAGRVVFASPLLLGRFSELVPGDPADLASFDPARWQTNDRRPGAWLPFGAGPHACPGRNLGIAQLTALAQWAVSVDICLSDRVSIDQSRGIAPSPCRFTIAPRSPTS
jgi:hypothetical protein